MCDIGIEMDSMTLFDGIEGRLRNSLDRRRVYNGAASADKSSTVPISSSIW
jgi:hypothetical protein